MAGKRGNSEGSIYKRADGKWCASVTLGRKANGALKRKVFYGDSRKEVADKLQKAQESLNQGIDISAGGITVEQWTERYLEIYKKNIVRDITYDSYKYSVKNYLYPYLGNVPLDKLRPDMAQQWINTLMQTKSSSKNDETLSTRTITYVRTVFKSAMEQAVRDGILLRNPVSGTKLPPKDSRKFQAMTRADYEKFIPYLLESKYSFAPLFLVSLMTGMRPTELVGLKWENIDFENKVINVRESAVNMDKRLYVSNTKTYAGKREIPMTPFLFDALKKQEQVSKNNPDNALGLVFPSEKGTYLNKNNIYRALKQETARAGVAYTSMRGLRHTFGTRGAEAGIHPAIMQQLMGHSSSQTTLDYYTEAQTESKLDALDKINPLSNK